MPTILKVWSWRQAIAKAKLEPNTKLVLYTLANYMNEHGGGCYPTIDMITEESGLSRRSVITHLDNAIAAGFIRKKRHGFGGQQWANNEYNACYPQDCELDRQTQDVVENSASEGSVTIAPPLLNEQEKGSAAIAPAYGKVVQPLQEGSANNDTKVVQPLHTNSPLNSPDNTPAAAGEKQETPPPSPQAIDAAAAEIIKAFDSILSQEFGITRARTEAQRGTRRPDDLLHARQFLTDGADVNFCKQVFRKKFVQRKSMGGKQPGGLSYFSRIMGEELLMARANGQVTPKKPASNDAEKWELTIADIGEDTPENRGFLKMLNALRARHGEAVFSSWMAALRLQHKNCSVLTVSAPSRLHADTVRQRYADDLKTLAAKVWPEITSVLITAR